MKAIHRQPKGFQQMTNIYQNSINMEIKQLIQDTSTKKYPNNKYYQFNDEDSSGRKYLKQKLNLDDPCNNGIEYHKHPQSTFFLQQNFAKQQDSNKLIQNSILQQRLHKPKDPSLTNNAKTRLSNKSSSYSKYRMKKSSACTSTTQSRCQTKNNVIQSSRNHLQSTQNQLKYYKQLCIDIRKKNFQLTKQLHQCKEYNRKSIKELQKKVDKISVKYINQKQNKENQDQNKADKIIQSLRLIKGKLTKKQNEEMRQEKKFYQFFVESLGILQSAKMQSNNKYTLFQVQNLWKQILQFLITHSFKIDSNCKIKTIR